MADMCHFLDMADMTSFVRWAEEDSPGHRVLGPEWNIYDVKGSQKVNILPLDA
jgi:hypothetical protein